MSTTLGAATLTLRAGDHSQVILIVAPIDPRACRIESSLVGTDLDPATAPVPNVDALVGYEPAAPFDADNVILTHVFRQAGNWYAGVRATVDCTARVEVLQV